MFIIHPNYVAGGIMPARHFIFTSIIILSSSVFAQEPTAPEVTSEPIAISEVKEVAPQATVPAIQAEPIAPPAPVAPTPAPAPAPTVDPKVEAMQKQIEEMQKQLQTLTAPKVEPQPKQKPALLPVGSTPSPNSTTPNSAITPLSVPAIGGLRKRDISLGWNYAHTYQKTTAAQGGPSVTDDQTSTKMKFEIARNLARFEFGAMLNFNRAESDGTDATMTVLGAMGRINLIENLPGNDFIPYFVGYLGLVGLTFNGDSSSDYEISGTGSALGLGFNWFPFSQIFALNAELLYSNGQMENEATPRLEVELKETTLNLGWKIYF
ncbi:hypothetical protein [Bdellovibrio bacteriovorus]|uniref:hypothetical protein n=1 Tax=Bdellovibrio bacteriovorus TaxID=959 RepID=UPI003D008DFE